MIQIVGPQSLLRATTENGASKQPDRINGTAEWSQLDQNLIRVNTIC